MNGGFVMSCWWSTDLEGRSQTACISTMIKNRFRGGWSEIIIATGYNCD